MTYDQALNRAASLCSQSERAPQDIYQKALDWGLSEDDASRLIAYLTQEHFLDERRFALAFVGDKFRFDHWGRIKISYALKMKGISSSIISEAIEERIDEEEYQTVCAELLKGRMRGMSLPLSPNDRARLYRFLAQRGFESSVISRAMP